jgi:hypothetical protein
MWESNGTLDHVLLSQIRDSHRKARQVKNKIKSMLIIFIDIKGIVHKEFILTGQIINPTYCCDVLRLLRENARRLFPELW